MIHTRNEITELLKEYAAAQHEIVYRFWSGESNEKLKVSYFNGIVLGKFRENDPLTRQMMKEGVNDNALYTEISAHLEHRIQMLEQLDEPDLMQQMQLAFCKNKQTHLFTDSLDDWIRKYCGWIKKEVTGIPDSEVKVLLYLYYAFDNYDFQKKHPFCSDLDELETAYGSILDKHSQFHKYGIVPVDENRELIPLDLPRIYDRAINKTFFTKNVPGNLLEEIAEMIAAGMVKDFSVRLCNEPGYEGKLDCAYLAEALERGKVFDFASLGNFSVSRLYSEKYENCMWVVIDPRNITFEELCDNFETYHDMIVTQVVHLQYEKEKDSAYITHLDHEYVFYTVEEYENRLRDITQKGAAKTRMKSFKIDHSKIPFDFRCKIFRKDENGNDLPQEEEQFLLFILECYFKHKDLLKEYFQKV